MSILMSPSLIQNKKYASFFKSGLFFILLFFVINPISSAPQLLIKKKPIRPLYVEGELLVKPKKILSHNASKQFISASGHSVKKSIGNNGLTVVKLAKGESVSAAMSKYKATSAYELVQPNFYYYPLIAPNDANYAQLWGLKNTSQIITSPSYTLNNPGTFGYDIDAELAWDIHKDCSSIVVAVIDTGVNYLHEDLTNNKWVNSAEFSGTATVDDDGNGVVDDIYGFDALAVAPNGGDPMAVDASYHGTHVAGTIAAEGNNGKGITGVCQSAQVMSIRVLGLDGGYTSTVIEGVNYAVANGAKVINMSLGGGGYDTLFYNALTAAKAAGVVVVVAAGNDTANTDFTPTYPCNYNLDNILCIAALDQKYGLASFSNYGANHVDIGAPGTNILSTWPGESLLQDFVGWTDVQTLGNANTWAESVCSPYDVLSYPFDQCSVGGNYDNDQDKRTYKVFDLSTYKGANIDYGIRIRTADSSDKFTAAYKNTGGGDPFAASVTNLGSTLFGDYGSDWLLRPAESLEDCLVPSCSVGFQFVSGSSGVHEGVSLLAMNIHTVEDGSTSYNLIDGTSMAAPHAAGVAALVYSYNPNYTAIDVVTALKNSGERISSLVGKTTTSKALNAYNALRYIQAPTGLSAVAQ